MYPSPCMVLDLSYLPGGYGRGVCERHEGVRNGVPVLLGH